MRPRIQPLNAPQKCILNAFLAFITRYERDGLDDDLTRAMTTACQAVEKSNEEDPAIGRYLANLGIAHRYRYERYRNEEDYDTALELTLRSLQYVLAEHLDRPHFLHLLGTLRWVHFEATGNRNDITSALQAERAAVDLAQGGNPRLPMYQAWLGAVYQSCYERFGKTEHLDSAIELLEAALQGSRVEDRQLFVYIGDLAIAYQSRFCKQENEPDLQAAMRLSEWALELSRTKFPAFLAQRLNNLATLFVDRHHSDLRRDDDLLEAFRISDEALAASSLGGLSRQAVLVNRGDWGWRLLSETGAAEYRDHAIAAYRELIAEKLYDPVNRLLAYRQLGRILRDSSLSEAAECYRQAVSILATEIGRTDLEWGDREFAIGRYFGLIGEAVAAQLELAGKNGAVAAIEVAELGRGILMTQILNTKGDLFRLSSAAPELATRFEAAQARLRERGHCTVVTIRRNGCSVGFARPANRGRSVVEGTARGARRIRFDRCTDPGIAVNGELPRLACHLRSNDDPGLSDGRTDQCRQTALRCSRSAGRQRRNGTTD